MSRDSKLQFLSEVIVLSVVALIIVEKTCYESQQASKINTTVLHFKLEVP